MNTIDYSKYANKSLKELANYLSAAEKKVIRLQEKAELEIQMQNDLIAYLKSKINKTLNKTKSGFIPYTESEAYKIGREREKIRTPEEQAELKKEVESFVYGKQSNEL